ncbi:hypothetical protein GS429_21125 [Natronorubrum sp. JWXQ-INN-674]|uniref:Uncharacterized protein n=1 Tax=Natronorubrum halalkaliphilum TaxID=2691917 RepID=A0A6B0VSL4_9EURY|nr:hypothetical protein [Natronorubrum halalkaliphilum]MXV64528.1 hypothetical protein [Natronorubrum halalkaliphilum]
MRGPGILWMLQTAVGMSMAGPMFVVGFNYLRSGRLIGGVGFLALGAVALYFPTYLVNRIGGPRAWLRRRLGRHTSDADEEVDNGQTDDEQLAAENASLETTSDRGSDADPNTDSEGSGGQPTFLERFRR